MKKFLLLFFLVISSLTFGQLRNTDLDTDSLLGVYNDSNLTEKVRMHALRQMVHVLTYSAPDEALNYMDEWEAYVKRIDDGAQMITVHTKKSMCYANMGNIDKWQSSLEALLDVCKKQKDTLQIAITYQNLGAAAAQVGDLEKASKYILEGVKLLENRTDGLLFLRNGYVNIAGLLMELKDYKATFPYLRKAWNLDQSDRGDIALLSLSEIHYQLGNLDSASYYLEKVNPTGYILTDPIQHITYLVQKGNIADATGQEKEALISFEEALNLQEASGIYWYTTTIAGILGGIYLEDGLYQKTIQLCEEGYAFGIENGDESSIMKNLAEILAEAYEQTGKYQLALKYSKRANDLERSILSEENIAAIASGEAEFRVEKKRIADSLQNAQNLAIKNRETLAARAQSQWIVGVSIAGGLILMAFLFFALNRNKIIRKQKELLNSDFQNLKEFTENASHEMQTPMAIINSKLETLMQGETMTPGQIENIQMIYSATYRMSTMNRSLLMLSKIENNQFPVDQQLNLSKMFTEIMQDFDELMEHKELRKEVLIQPEITVKANEFLTSTIFYNLVKNAISHNIERGDIKISLDNDKFIIENSGKDLADDPMSMFDRFKKFGNNENSTGLGLAIVKKSCESQGWNVKYVHSSGLHSLTVKFS